jgi:hypothetical protein
MADRVSPARSLEYRQKMSIAKGGVGIIDESAAALHRRAKNREAIRLRLKLDRQAAIAHYGGSCACCGETQYEFLVFDHVNGGGRAHRREVRQTGHFASWLRRQNYPDYIQVLCANCNTAKAYYGGCPHKEVE